MKIIFITRYVPPQIEGIGEYTFHLASQLQAMGEDVKIVTDLDQKAEVSWILPRIQTWDRLSILNAISDLKPDVVCLQYAPPLYDRLGFCWNLSGVTSFLKEKLKCRIAVTFHEFQTAWSLHPKLFLRAAILRMQTWRLLKGCDTAIATCQSYADILLSYGSCPNVITIPVGASILPGNFSQQELESLKTKYGIQGGKIFTFFGRLSGFRNFETALRVLQEARAQKIPAFLLLLGCLRASNPALFESFIHQAKDSGLEKYIIETGELENREISKHLQITDVFLFPQTDGISTRNTTVMSAMAHGLPIVTYEPVPGNYNQYKLPYGSKVKRGDTAAFIAQALSLIQEPENTTKTLLQKEYFADNFSWEIQASLYREALKRAK